MQTVHLQIKEKGGKVSNVTQFNHGMARGLMLNIAMLQDDLHDFQDLSQIDNGLPLTTLHAAIYNEIFAAKKSLERAHQLLATGSIAEVPINVEEARINELDIKVRVEEALINELKMWRGPQP